MKFYHKYHRSELITDGFPKLYCADGFETFIIEIPNQTKLHYGRRVQLLIESSYLPRR